MAYTTNTNANAGFFLPTTASIDVSRINEVDVNSPEFKQLLVQLYQFLNQSALAINNKPSGYFLDQEFNCGSLYFKSGSSTPFDLRPVFRKVIDCGALPNNATKSVAHGITVTSSFVFTKIYGAATDPSTDFIPLPYASSTAAENIELSVDATNVNITTGNDRTGFTTTYVVLEYLKV